MHNPETESKYTFEYMCFPNGEKEKWIEHCYDLITWKHKKGTSKWRPKLQGR